MALVWETIIKRIMNYHGNITSVKRKESALGGMMNRGVLNSVIYTARGLIPNFLVYVTTSV